MPELRDPSPVQHRSFLAALAEYRLEGLHTDLDVHALTDVRSFAHWIAEGTPDASVPERDRVPHRILWWVDGPEYLGRLRLNLELNDELREFGGHIGYDVRPTARGRGHATAMLAEALIIAREHGLEEVLLTCAEDNVASQRTIERNGGRFVDVSAAGRWRFVILAPEKG